MKRLWRKLKKATGNDKGITTVEIILILVVLLALVVIFREQLMGIVNDIFGHIGESVNELY